MKLGLPEGLVDPFDMKPSDVKLADIVHSTSLICRYNGYVRHHYSVAQHMVLVCTLAEIEYGAGEVVPQAALLHDAVETYVGDVVIPVKRRLPGFQDLENEIDEIVWHVLGLQDTVAVRDEVHRFDMMALGMELDTLLFYRVCDLAGIERTAKDEHWTEAGHLLKFRSPERAKRLYARKLQTYGYSV